MNKLLLFLLLPVCALAQTPDKDFKLKGTLKLAKPVDWVYLYYSNGTENITDSLQLKNNEFKFEGKVAEPTVARLVVKFVKAAGEERAKRDMLAFFLEPGKMEIVSKDSLKVNSVTGSAGHVDFVKLNKEAAAYDEPMNKLNEDYMRYRTANDKASMDKVEGEMDAIQKQIDEKVYGAFVRSHPNSPVALYALKQYAGWDINPDQIDPMLHSLPASVQKWPSAVSLQQQVNIARQTGIGREAMDFTQNDTLGNPVSLRSFRGKFVLVDFWASWCGPCRRENPNVVKAYNTYKDRNFTVLGVSLDRPDAKDKWLAAIHKDGLMWTQVSDLQYWDNAVAKQYGIRAIPQNYLIDPQGRIIGKNLTGEALVNKLEEVLK